MAIGILNQLNQRCLYSPDSVVFEQDGETITTQQLCQTASNLSCQLQNLGVGPDSKVCIVLPRGMDAAIAIYGTCLAQGCYIPVDSQSPTDRQRFIVKDSQAHCVIGSGAPPSWLGDLDIPYLDIQKKVSKNQPLVSNLTDNPQRIASILYTSGSTGTPKGVAISESAILAFAQWTQQTFSLTPNDRIANLAPFHFDLSLFDLFSGPLSGATTIFMPDALKFSPSKMVDWLITNTISTWYTVPSILSFLVLKGGLADKALPDLRQILFAGEVFPTSKLKQFTNLIPDTKFYNLFGPTETNVCLYWPVKVARLEQGKTIPAGLPACQATIKISIDNNELLVKGPCMMAGYWNNGEIELPLDDNGWFHTGDKISMNELGEYEYHGRLDRMIKNAGYRIEPAEIEAALNSVEGVNAAAVIGSADPVSGTKIMAAIDAPTIDQRFLHAQLAKKLPGYMQPRAYLFVDNMPILSNGKTDYQAVTKMIQSTDDI